MTQKLTTTFKQKILFLISIMLICALFFNSFMTVKAQTATISDVPATFNVMKPLTETELETGTKVFLSYRNNNLKGDLATTIAAIVTVTNTQNTSIDYHHGSFTYTIYVDVTFTNSLETFDDCPKGALVSNDGKVWEYFCWQGGKQNMPINAYITDTATGTLTVTMDDTKLHFDKDSTNKTVEKSDITSIQYEYTYDGVVKSGNFDTYSIKPDDTTIGTDDPYITVLYDLDNSEQQVTLPVDYAVYFDLHGGTGGTDYVESKQYQVASKIIEPSDPTKEGYTFYKWATTNSPDADAWDFANDTVHEVMTLHAIYKQNQSINANDITILYGDTSKLVYTLGIADTNQNIECNIINGNDVIQMDAEGNITTKKVGTATIKISAEENNQYTAAEKTITVTVNKRPITITANNKTKVYGDNEKELDYVISTTTPLVENDTIENSFTGNITREDSTNLNVGTYAIKQGTLASTKYEITFNNGTYTITPKAITISAENKTKIYGEDDPSLTFVLGSNTPMAYNETINNLTGSLTREEGNDVGTYTISQGTLNNANYDITFNNAVFTITQKAITVNAENKTKVYGDNDPELTYVLDENSNMAYNETIADGFTGSLVREEGNNVGEYTISQGTLTNSNYDITFNNAILTITKKPITIKAETHSKEYGNDDPELTYVLDETTPMAYDDTINDLTGNLIREEGQNVGDYTIYRGTLNNPNYDITYVENQLHIYKRTVMLSVDYLGKIYGDNDPDFEIVIAENTPLAYNETIENSFEGNVIREKGENVGAYKIKQGTLNNPNYDIKFTDGLLTIKKRPVTIIANEKEQIYGEKELKLDYTVSKETPLVKKDTIKNSFTGELALEENKTNNVGMYIIEQGTLSSDNYDITFEDAVYTIWPRPITIIIDDQTKVYGEKDPKFTYTLDKTTPMAYKETLDDILSGNLIRLIGNNVGTYTIGQGTLLDTTENYKLTFKNGTLTITPKPITVIIDNKEKNEGEKDPTFTFTTDTELVKGDKLDKAIKVELTRDAGETPNKYTITAKNIESDNYDVSYTDGILTINKVEKPIEQPKVVLNTPKTGDTFNPIIAISLMIVSFITIAGIIIFTRKRINK